ncbi:MAG: extracellular solute-binding protein [Treponema sp.]|nr:extracellular solute-binding protein [Treponema sp.]
MRKRLFLLAMICLALGLCACKRQISRPKNPDATLTLALRAGTYAEVIKKCLPAFEAEHNVLCNVLELSEDALHSLVAKDALQKEGAYDFCMVDGSWMAEYTAKGVLSNLSELGYALDDDIIPATKAICYYDGGLYLAPYYGNVTVLLYNKLMVKEAGLQPEDIKSLEDIQKICLVAKKRHNLGFMYRGDTANNIVVDFLPILLSYGGWVVDEQNKPTINTPEFHKAMYTYLSLIGTGRAAKKDDLIAAIANKSAAMGIGWPGWYTPTRNSSMDYLALSGRYRRESAIKNANIYGIWAVGIPANSRHKEYAAALLSYLMNANVQKETVMYGGVPCRYSSLRDEEILKKFPQYKVVCKALEGGVYRPVMEKWTEFYTILGKEMKLIIDGEKAVLGGLADAQKQLEKMLAE